MRQYIQRPVSQIYFFTPSETYRFFFLFCTCSDGNKTEYLTIKTRALGIFRTKSGLEGRSCYLSRRAQYELSNKSLALCFFLSLNIRYLKKKKNSRNRGITLCVRIFYYYAMKSIKTSLYSYGKRVKTRRVCAESKEEKKIYVTRRVTTIGALQVSVNKYSTGIYIRTRLRLWKWVEKKQKTNERENEKKYIRDHIKPICT